MFAAKESGIKLARWKWIFSAMNVLNEIVIIVVEPVKNESGELLILQRLANGDQCVGKTPHLVEVVRDDEVTKLGLTKLSAYRMST